MLPFCMLPQDNIFKTAIHKMYGGFSLKSYDQNTQPP